MTDQGLGLPAADGEVPAGLPLEVELVYRVRGCRSCSFFWPSDPAQQPYGPFPSFDVHLGDRQAPDPDPSVVSYPWMVATTRAPSFPDPEIADGCRKAPIMTIGINPNLTAFAPGTAGATWACPTLPDADGAD